MSTHALHTLTCLHACMLTCANVYACPTRPHMDYTQHARIHSLILTHIHTHVFTHLQHTPMCPHTLICMFTNRHTYVYTHTHNVHTHERAHPHMCTCTHMSTQKGRPTCPPIHAYIYTCTCMLVCVHMHMCTRQCPHAHRHVCKHAYSHMSKHAHSCAHTCKPAPTSTHTIHMHAHLSTHAHSCAHPCARHAHIHSHTLIHTSLQNRGRKLV